MKRRVLGEISIESFLQSLCLVLGCTIVSVYLYFGNTTYINGITIFGGLCLCVLLFFMLLDAKKNNNKLLIILAYNVLLYYVLRLITLNCTSYSTIFDVFSPRPEQINETLLVFIFSIVMLWIGVHHKRRINRYEAEIYYKRSCVNKSIILFVIALILNIIADSNYGLISTISSVIKTFILNVHDLMFLFLTYIMLVWKKTEKKQKILLISSMLIYALYLTLGGSRSGLITVFKMLFIVMLALDKKTIKGHYFIVAALMMPIMVFLFLYSTYMRQVGITNGRLSDKIEIVGTVLENNKDIDYIEIMSPVFNRIGYFDYTTRLYSQREKMQNVINWETETKSIIDNALTPGFDIFDAPKLSNALANADIYNFNSSVLLSKSKINDIDYGSSQLTLVGEASVLFGVPFCFILVYFVGLFFKRIVMYIFHDRTERSFLLMAMCLFLFDALFESFGIDWLILNIACFCITYRIFRLYVLNKK